MAKKWNKGVNCVLISDFTCGGIDFKKGDSGWIYEVTDDSLVVLTKTSEKVDASRAIKRVTIPLDSAEDVVKLTTGKPRKDFSSIFVTKEDLAALAASKMS